MKARREMNGRGQASGVEQRSKTASLLWQDSR